MSNMIIDKALNFIGNILNKNTNWTTITSGITYKVQNGWVIIAINGVSVSSGTTVIATLPQEIRPETSAINPFLRAQTTLLQCWITASTGALNVGATSAYTGVAGFVVYPLPQ